MAVNDFGIPSEYQKAVLLFNVNERSGPLFHCLQRHLSGKVFFWDVDLFPIHLPSPLLEAPQGKIQWADICKPPGQDLPGRLDRAALPKLSEQQLSDLRMTAKFRAPNDMNPAVDDTWEVSLLLQEGQEATTRHLYRSLASALEWVAVTLPQCLWGPGFSLRTGVYEVCAGVLMLPEPLLGYRSTRPENSDIAGMLRAEARAFVQGGCGVDVVAKGGTPPNDWSFPVELGISEPDLRLVEPKLRGKLAAALGKIEQDFALTWAQNEIRLRNALYEEALAEVQASGGRPAGDEEAEEEERERARRMQRQAMQIAVDRLFERRHNELVAAIRQARSLDKGSNGLADAVARRMEVERVWQECEAAEQAHAADVLEGARREVARLHTFRALIQSWKEDRVSQLYQERMAGREHMALREAIKRLKADGYSQEAYIAEGLLKFRVEREAARAAELRKPRVPSMTFSWERVIWRPSNWVVTRRPNGRGYDVQKAVVHTTDTRYPGWRLANIYQRAAQLFNNGNYALVSALVYGPTGVLSWLSPTSFHPDSTVDIRTGVLETNKLYEVTSMFARITSLWRHVAASRASFEAAPDRGILGKGVTRVYNMFWNYAIKGCCGTALIAATHTALTVATVAVCVPLIAASPVLAPALSVAAFLLSFGFYDACLGVPLPLVRILLRIAFGGVLQSGASIVLALLSPVFSLGTAGLGLLRYAARRTYDAVTAACILRPLGRVPVDNGFLVWRVAGPSLSQSVFSVIAPSDALVAVAAVCEQMEMDAYVARTQQIIQRPTHALHSAVSDALSPAGLSGSPVGAQFAPILSATAALNDRLHDAVQHWRKTRLLQLSHNCPPNLRQSHDDHERTVALTTNFLQEVIPSRVLARRKEVDENPDQFWQEWQLVPGDWRGLAKRVLAQVYGEQFLEPLEESDTVLQLNIEHVGLREFGTMLASNLPRDDLDKRSVPAFKPPPDIRRVSPTVPPISPEGVVRTVPRSWFGPWWHRRNARRGSWVYDDDAV